MTAYYNEIDPRAAAWLRELISEKHIAPGIVDERSITEITANDLKGFKQCHFFAGIGGWSYALRLANWPDDREVWTGSCPCQPFSIATQGKGIKDERHLWPAFRWLIAQSRPKKLFGEQVVSEDGRQWLSGVSSDLEAMGYYTGASDLCSAGVHSPNIRQRIYWVADTEGERRIERDLCRTDETQGPLQSIKLDSSHSRVVNPECARLERQPGHGENGDKSRRDIAQTPRSISPTSAVGYWDKFDILGCLDGKARRIEPGSFPLAHGIPERVGLLRGYGNAINPYVAKIFIEASEII